MSYSEKDGQIVLTMSRDDFSYLIFALGFASGEMLARGEKVDGMFRLVNRINEGNPDYTPYQVEEIKS